jgi:hypothetical protein
MQVSKETKERLAGLLEEDLKVHLAAVTRITADIAVLRGNKPAIITLFENGGGNGDTKKPKIFREVVRDILLADGVPKTSRQLMIQFNAGREKQLSMSAFSAQLSVAVKDGYLRFHIEEGAPISERHWYGVTEWFQGDKLKRQYEDKIKPPQV